MLTKLSQFRKELKGIGFKVKTETFSFGKVATFLHLEMGNISIHLATDLPKVEANKDLQSFLDGVSLEEYQNIYENDSVNVSGGRFTNKDLTK